ncbi:MAG TPA: PDZ domain-containing protein [Candidatus Hydrogenedentes bacterium]|nr:PDZ domain-containing protein [Candidatus Hydrogenedentota bacterium]HOH50307.1 PDZ domain-containing protein [Candidatus Hydrogenedentota bacterium]
MLNLSRRCFSRKPFGLAALLLAVSFSGFAQDAAEEPGLSGTIKEAVSRVKPALVRIHVVDTYYDDGRELKSESSGSGAIIREDGHIITNHHVAGHAKHLKCTFADKTEMEAELVGTDPMTDIAVIRLKGAGDRKFPVAPFGDSSLMRMGDHVLAMGSPLSLSQSVTLGIVSNSEVIMPAWMDGGLSQDGENVGALVRWIGHDADIFPGNSGGPLVNLQGEVIGINEIKMGLGGAIPGNLAREVAEALIATGSVARAWLGLELQPRLKSDTRETGALVATVVKDSPAEAAGFKPGDRLLSLAGTAVDVRFPEQLPDFNRLAAGLPVGSPVAAVVERGDAPVELTVTPVQREPYEPKQFEQTQWGLTVRDISFMKAREMKRKDSDGVLVTSVRPGGPSSEAKPPLEWEDVLLSVGGKPVKSVKDFMEATEALTKDQTAPVPVLAEFDRKTERLVTVVKVGVRELMDPGREAQKAWLPVETQVLTKDIAESLGVAGRKGFRVTFVYPEAAEILRPGDLIFSVDGQELTASNPEDSSELETLIRQYSIGGTAELGVHRDGGEVKVSAVLARSPKTAKEMKRYTNETFEFTVRDITLRDRTTERWADTQEGVLVEQVQPGGWAALGTLMPGDLIVEMNNAPSKDVAAAKEIMKGVEEQAQRSLVFKVVRGIRTLFLEMEPRWEKAPEKKAGE